MIMEKTMLDVNPLKKKPLLTVGLKKCRRGAINQQHFNLSSISPY
jgi:hypothetical protein